MKKYLAAVLLGAMVLTGCGGNADTGTNEVETVSQVSEERLSVADLADGIAANAEWLEEKAVNADESVKSDIKYYKEDLERRAMYLRDATLEYNDDQVQGMWDEIMYDDTKLDELAQEAGVAEEYRNYIASQIK